VLFYFVDIQLIIILLLPLSRWNHINIMNAFQNIHTINRKRAALALTTTAEN